MLNNIIQNNNIDIALKDGSRICLKNNYINKNFDNVSIFIKKNMYQAPTLFIDNQLIESSNLTHQNCQIETIIIKVGKINQKNNIVIGEGGVEVTDSEGKLIKADKVTYEKSKEFLLAEGSVEVIDVEGHILKSDKATYDKKSEKMITYENSELITAFE